MAHSLVREHLKMTAASVRIGLGGWSYLRPNLVKLSLKWDELLQSWSPTLAF